MYSKRLGLAKAIPLIALNSPFANLVRALSERNRAPEPSPV